MDIEGMYDAAVVGCGPTGLAMAALLARRGFNVIAFEKHPERYGLPRAGHIDHEIVRILQGVDAHQPILNDDPELDSYDWKTADGEVLLSFPFGESSVSGFQSDYMMFQPVLDDALYDSLDRAPRATVVLGAEVVGLTSDASGVDVDVVRTRKDGAGATVQTGEKLRVRAAYVIAADGAGSPVRAEFLGIGRLDKGFNEAWLDVDVRVKRALPRSVNGQWCDPARPIYIGPLGRRHHRFEWALLPGETAEEALRPDATWKVLAKYGVGPDDVEPFRQIVYTFEARVAERWTDGRILLIGDAAHTMPPHMGQGLCSGIRDAANLAWKLDLVLRDLVSDALLETYEVERRPHVETWIDLSVAVGRISQVLDPELAAERDEAMRSGSMPPLPEPPLLRHGIVDLDSQGALVGAAGTLFVQAPVETQDARGLLHDVFGHGFLVASAQGDPSAMIDDEAAQILRALGAKSIWLGDPASGGFRDPTGRIGQYFDAAGAAAVLVRPDYYVAGGAAGLGGLPALIKDIGSKIGLQTAVAR